MAGSGRPDLLPSGYARASPSDDVQDVGGALASGVTGAAALKHLPWPGRRRLS